MYCDIGIFELYGGIVFSLTSRGTSPLFKLFVAKNESILYSKNSDF
jgi:hypothetical protein